MRTEEEERRREWIEAANAALAPDSRLGKALVDLAKAFEESKVMTLDVRLRPFMATSFPGSVAITTADPDFKPASGCASVGPGQRMEDRPVEMVGGIELVAVHGDDMAACTQIALGKLAAELRDRATTSGIG